MIGRNIHSRLSTATAVSRSHLLRFHSVPSPLLNPFCLHFRVSALVIITPVCYCIAFSSALVMHPTAFIPSVSVLCKSQSDFIKPLRQTSSPRRRIRTRDGLRMQTWSDPAVTQEYMDYLGGVNQREDKKDCTSTIVGNGRIGNFLFRQGPGDDLILSRGESIPKDAPGPVYVCTRNDDLEDIILNCPDEKREDLVFVQNGYVENLLRKYALDDNTKANLYFAVSQFGGDAVDGVTELNPDGLTAVTGKWEYALYERITKAGLTCKIMKDRDFRRSSLEKLIWICTFNLIGAVHGNITMGEISDMHVKEVTDLSLELAQMVRFTLTVGMMPNIEDRMLAYGTAVKDFKSGLKEFKWRNGFFYEYSQLAKNNGFPDPTPMHS